MSAGKNDASEHGNVSCVNDVPGVTRGTLEDALTDTILDLGDSVAELLGDCLALEGLNGVRMRRSRHDDERDNGDLGASLLEAVIQACKALDEHVNTLVAVLIPARGEHIQCVVEVKVVVAVKVSAHKVIDLGLRESVQILELVHRLEFDDVESIGKDTVRLALEEMFALVRGDVRHGCKYVCTVRCRAFNAVSTPAVQPQSTRVCPIHL